MSGAGATQAVADASSRGKSVSVRQVSEGSHQSLLTGEEKKRLDVGYAACQSKEPDQALKRVAESPNESEPSSCVVPDKGDEYLDIVMHVYREFAVISSDPETHIYSTFEASASDGQALPDYPVVEVPSVVNDPMGEAIVPVGMPLAQDKRDVLAPSEDVKDATIELMPPEKLTGQVILAESAIVGQPSCSEHVPSDPEINKAVATESKEIQEAEPLLQVSRVDLLALQRQKELPVNIVTDTLGQATQTERVTAPGWSVECLEGDTELPVKQAQSLGARLDGTELLPLRQMHSITTQVAFEDIQTTHTDRDSIMPADNKKASSAGMASVSPDLSASPEPGANRLNIRHGISTGDSDSDESFYAAEEGETEVLDHEGQPDQQPSKNQYSISHKDVSRADHVDHDLGRKKEGIGPGPGPSSSTVVATLPKEMKAASDKAGNEAAAPQRDVRPKEVRPTVSKQSDDAKAKKKKAKKRKEKSVTDQKSAVLSEEKTVTEKAEASVSLDNQAGRSRVSSEKKPIVKPSIGRFKLNLKNKLVDQAIQFLDQATMMMPVDDEGHLPVLKMLRDGLLHKTHIPELQRRGLSINEMIDAPKGFHSNKTTVFFYLVVMACESGDRDLTDKSLELIESFLALGADPNQWCDLKQGVRWPLVGYVVNMRKNKVLALLKKQECNMNVVFSEKDQTHYTPLMLAIEKEKGKAGPSAIVKTLIEGGANINQTVKKYTPESTEITFTPLMFALALGNMSLARQVVKAGADINIPKTVKNVEGSTVKELYPTMHMVQRRNIDDLKKFLEAASAKPDSINQVNLLNMNHPMLERSRQSLTALHVVVANHIVDVRDKYNERREARNETIKSQVQKIEGETRKVVDLLRQYGSDFKCENGAGETAHAYYCSLFMRFVDEQLREFCNKNLFTENG